MDTVRTIRVSADEMQARFETVLGRIGYDQDRANQCAKVFVDNSLDGVYTHGVNRFVRFVRNTQEGLIIPDAVPELTSAAGAFEQWHGRLGPGILNAQFCTTRAMALASTHGLSCVAIGNTNHWMRGGTYGWMAARLGYALFAWTNTIANMPVWGDDKPVLGNNPLVVAIPYKDTALVLDFAMSQYSYGKLELSRMQHQLLPMPGGFDKDGNLTNDPAKILDSGRILQTGFWKGAGLSLALDVLAASLSGGKTVTEISQQASESGLSQVFIAIDLNAVNSNRTLSIRNHVNAILDEYKNSGYSYPGERAHRLREENNSRGIPVLETVWDEIRTL